MNGREEVVGDVARRPVRARLPELRNEFSKRRAEFRVAAVHPDHPDRRLLGRGALSTEHVRDELFRFGRRLERGVGGGGCALVRVGTRVVAKHGDGDLLLLLLLGVALLFSLLGVASNELLRHLYGVRVMSSLLFHLDARGFSRRARGQIDEVGGDDVEHAGEVPSRRLRHAREVRQRLAIRQ